jgi:hypothetical protein
LTRLDAPTEELGPLGERIAGQPRTAPMPAAKAPPAQAPPPQAPSPSAQAPPAQAPSAQAPSAQAPPSPLSAPRSGAGTGERCAGCGAALASDQRYCVECGQRLGRARLPFMDDPARPFAQAPEAAPGRRRLSVNSTLIAGVGTLLLAMGIGILIGRSSPGSSAKSAGPVQVLTVPGTGAAGAAGATESQGAAGGSSVTSGGSSPSAAKGAKTPAKPAAKPKLPPAKVVTVGSPGKGKGYENGHFTGNFFGKGEE